MSSIEGGLGIRKQKGLCIWMPLLGHALDVITQFICVKKQLEVFFSMCATLFKIVDAIAPETWQIPSNLALQKLSHKNE